MEAFVYGTLTDPDRAAAVLDSFGYRGEAVLDGLHRVEGAYPTLAPGGSVEGRILATDDVAALDAYEGTDRGLYVRVSVPAAGESGAAAGPPRDEVAVYVGDPQRLGADADWPGTGTFPERVRRYVAAEGVVVRRQ